MTIRRVLWDDQAAPVATRPLGRFAGHDPGVPFFGALWAAVVAAECAALIPVLSGSGAHSDGLDVLFRIMGGSFVACGLIAWRRRPDSRAGLLMTVTGFSLFIVPVGSQVHAALAQTSVWLFSDLWTIPFVALLLTFVTGGRVRSRTDRALLAAFVVPLLVTQRDDLAAVVSEGAGVRAVGEELEDLPIRDVVLGAPLLVAKTAAVAVFGNDTPPPNLRRLLSRITAPVFLIYAEHGEVDPVNPSYFRALRAPKQQWVVPRGGHTGAIRALPHEYERRVTAFFARTLLGPAVRSQSAHQSR